MDIVFDIEANGLYYDADTVWCISLSKDPLQGSERPVESFSDYSDPRVVGSIENALEVLSDASTLIGHNIINYDLPLLKKLYGWTPSEHTKIFDTFIVSSTLYPDRPKPSGYASKGGSHSLECWGYRVGKSKPDHEDWSVFSPDMLRRNREDVEINIRVYNSLRSEIGEWDWQESIDLEHKIAKIITQQEHNGVQFNVEQAYKYIQELEDKIQDIDNSLVDVLPKKVKQKGATVLEPYTRTGKHSSRYREDISYCSGPFTRIDYEAFNLGSVSQVKDLFLENGWVPDEWNYNSKTGERTSPKLTGEFEGIEGTLPKAVKRRLLLRHRKSQIEGWLPFVRDDQRISAGAFTCGTNTGRMRHTVVVNVPKANSDKETGELIWDTEKQKDFFGTQMRSLFCCREGYKLVGHDAAGLELRMLAHYMGDLDYIEEILNGDIHEHNRKAAGLDTRDLAKSFIYAFLYGAGDEKLGSLIGGTAKDGRRLRLKFLSSLPMLERLLRNVKRRARRGYLEGLDGRKVFMRYDKEDNVMTHKALNTLLQHSGSILMKKSSEILWDQLVPQSNIEAYKVIDMHDECQAEVLIKDIELYKQLAVQSVVMAGEHFKLKIPMAADAKVGNNWAETH